MSSRILKYVTPLVLLTIAVSCSKVPGYVIPPDKMAQILADVHVGEAVIDLNRNDYRTDSTKQLMLQSVLAKHDVNKHDLDTSFDWYGHNISYYMEVYDKTIELLERRIAETGNRIAAENISIAGDSVDVWNSSPFIALNNLSPSNFLTFSLNEDENWEKGDSYTWRAKFTNNAEKSLWGIMADYDDGSMEIFTSDLSGDGWQELSFICDSTKTAKRVYGYLSITPRGATTVWADSLMLIRNRLNQETYRHHYRQQRIKPKNAEKIMTEATDSVK